MILWMKIEQDPIFALIKWYSRRIESILDRVNFVIAPKTLAAFQEAQALPLKGRIFSYAQ